GIVVSPFSGQVASVAFNGLEITANVGDGVGLVGSGTVAGTLRNSLVGENGSIGVAVAASQSYFTVEQSSIVDNLAYGIAAASAGTYVSVGASTIGGNGIGVGVANGGTINSFGNNKMSVNGSNGAFTAVTPLQ